MGWASERQIEIHNDLMESNAEYAEDFAQWMLEQAVIAEMEESEEFDLFGYKIDHTGYIETYKENKNYV